MAYNADILADSTNEHGDRLTTFEVTFPRVVLSEFNTHRMFSRNSASSRAIPVEKQLMRVLDDPFVPTYWGINQSGMQAAAELDAAGAEDAEKEWLLSRDFAVLGAVALTGGPARLQDSLLQQRILEIEERLEYPGVPLATPLHKQIANRLLEPFMWHTVIVTATDYDNFFALRASPQAEPAIQQIAYRMQDLYAAHEPDSLGQDEWHLPLIQLDERDLPLESLKKISSGRCARVSYLTHDTGKRDTTRDIELHDTLRQNGHMSPFEHVARPMTADERETSLYSGNFRGFHQYRKDIPNEQDYSRVG